QVPIGGIIMKGKRIVILFIALVLGVLALALMPMRAQNQGYPFPGYPIEFAPSRTSRPRPTPAPPPTTKFNRAERAIPNEYIVFLNDDTPNANVNTIINSLANAHGGLDQTQLQRFSKGLFSSDAGSRGDCPKQRPARQICS